MSVLIQRKARIKVQPATTAPRSLWMTQLARAILTVPKQIY